MTPSAKMVRRDSTGQFTLDAEILAKRFGWSTEELHDLMRRHRVTSRIERGEGDDEGRWRLSVRCGNRQWHAIVETDCAIVHEAVDFVAPMKATLAGSR
ncbi:MAG: DUF6522 family protein [Rhizobiaceae bacterium]|nr:DUF6522 family protein [Rhizobiaceae bacterium]